MVKKRLGIFVFYNAEGKVENYLTYLLDSMFGLFEKLVIVVNGILEDEGADKLGKYSKDIIFRENNGFDGGAYKEIITRHLGRDGLKDFDQCVLFNDTFCGPFHEWDDIFLKMENKEMDFWGLSKWVGDINIHPEHIQSYFLVIEKTLLHSETFMDFWENMQIPKSHADAIKNFEAGLTQCFSKNGFRYLTWMEMMGGDSLLRDNAVVYYDHAGDLIVRHSFPVLKKKACTSNNMGQLVKIKEYIENGEKEFFKMIYTFIDKASKENEGFSSEALEEFYYSHAKIYIYGNGKCAEMLRLYFAFKDWKAGAVIVTEKKQNEGVVEYKEVEFGENDGVIVATGVKYNKEIYNNIRKDWENLDIFFMFGQPEIRL